MNLDRGRFGASDVRQAQGAGFIDIEDTSAVRLGVATAVAMTMLAGCGARETTALMNAPLPAPQVATSTKAVAPEADYRIGPRDVLMVSVYGEPQLTFDSLPVSSGGYVSLPLIGELEAAGRTAGELGRLIDQRLGARYLRNPQVAVAVKTAVNYTVTLDGAVNRPGVYDIPGQVSLLQSLALAQGPAQFAKLNEVVVVRQMDGQRYAARFDLREIRRGAMPDFPLRQQDTVIVGYDAFARLFRDAVTSLPAAAAVFVALR